MTTEDFKLIWPTENDKLSSFDRNRLTELDLDKKSVEFLTSAGLPASASPFLSFVKNTKGDYDSIGRLTEYYDFLGQGFEKLIMIGSCGNGDPIVINTDKECQIEWLDHENNFGSFYFNSSIVSLCESLVAYRQFVQNTILENGEDAFLNSDFTDKQHYQLIDKLKLADINSITNNGFWKDVIEMDLANREDFRNTTS